MAEFFVTFPVHRFFRINFYEHFVMLLFLYAKESEDNKHCLVNYLLHSKKTRIILN